MKRTEQTLLEQMRITEFEIANRKELFAITPEDEALLKSVGQQIERKLKDLIDQFYEAQTSIPEIALLIGDADTLSRLKTAQHRYVLDLFSGTYDIEYVNNRLRIGLVHQRIGVEPKLYLAAIMALRELLRSLIETIIPDVDSRVIFNKTLMKLIMFDITLVFDTYIRSLVSEAEIAKEKSELYASSLEDKVKERTQQLEMLSRTDPLTGLLNMRHLDETLNRSLRFALRRGEPVILAYLDINDFKIINDTLGHQRGDEILKMVANALRVVSRAEDFCFRQGGDEFCVVMINCCLADAEQWKNRLLETLEAERNSPRLSIGFAQTGPDRYVSAAELIRMADEAMYAAKKRMKGG